MRACTCMPRGRSQARATAQQAPQATRVLREHAWQRRLKIRDVGFDRLRWRNLLTGSRGAACGRLSVTMQRAQEATAFSPQSTMPRCIPSSRDESAMDVQLRAAFSWQRRAQGSCLNGKHSKQRQLRPQCVSFAGTKRQTKSLTHHLLQPESQHREPWKHCSVLCLRRRHRHRHALVQNLHHHQRTCRSVCLESSDASWQPVAVTAP